MKLKFNDKNSRLDALWGSEDIMPSVSHLDVTVI
jgi:hypothetical protein